MALAQSRRQRPTWGMGRRATPSPSPTRQPRAGSDLMARSRLRYPRAGPHHSGHRAPPRDTRRSTSMVPEPLPPTKSSPDLGPGQSPSLCRQVSPRVRRWCLPTAIRHRARTPAPAPRRQRRRVAQRGSSRRTPVVVQISPISPLHRPSTSTPPTAPALSPRRSAMWRTPRRTTQLFSLTPHPSAASRRAVSSQSRCPVAGPHLRRRPVAPRATRL